MQKQKIKDKRYEHVSFLGSCFYVEEIPNKTRRLQREDFKDLKRAVCAILSEALLLIIEEKAARSIFSFVGFCMLVCVPYLLF